MAKDKKQSKGPQAKHRTKSRSSQHDKRKRLDTPNPRRRQQQQMTSESDWTHRILGGRRRRRRRCR